MGADADPRRERAEGRRLIRETRREIRSLTLEQVLHMVGVAWRNRRRRPTDWKLIAINVNLVRHEQEEEAWLRCQLEGLEKEGA
jgi:hypothetical protein